MVDEVWKSHSAGFFTRKWHRFVRPYDRVVVKLKEAGIFDHVLSGYILQAAPADVVNAELMVLKIEHYEGPFYLLMILLAFDMIIFLLEYSTSKKYKRSPLTYTGVNKIMEKLSS